MTTGVYTHILDANMVPIILYFMLRYSNSSPKEDFNMVDVNG